MTWISIALSLVKLVLAPFVFAWSGASAILRFALARKASDTQKAKDAQDSVALSPAERERLRRRYTRPS